MQYNDRRILMIDSKQCKQCKNEGGLFPLTPGQHGTDMVSLYSTPDTYKMFLLQGANKKHFGLICGPYK